MVSDYKYKDIASFTDNLPLFLQFNVHIRFFICTRTGYVSREKKKMSYLNIDIMSAFLRKYLVKGIFILVISCVVVYFNESTLDNRIGWDIVSELKTTSKIQPFKLDDIHKIDVSLPVYYVNEYYNPQKITGNNFVTSFVAILLLLGVLGILYATLHYRSKYAFYVYISTLSFWTVSMRLENIFETAQSGSFLLLFIPLAFIGYLIHSFPKFEAISRQIWLIIALLLVIGYLVLAKINESNLTSIIANGFYFYVFLVLIFLFLIANVIFSYFIKIISSTSIEKGKSYWPKIFLIFGIYFVNVFILYAQEIKLIEVQQQIFTPIVLFVISCIIATLQSNQWQRNTQIAFWSGIAVAYSLTFYADFLIHDGYREFIREFITISYLLVPLAFLIFLLANFYSLIQQGLPIHKVWEKPIHLKWILPQIAAIFGILFFLSFKNGYSINQLIATQQNLLADYHLEKKEESIAESYLKKSVSFDLYNFKANYTLATLAKKYGDNASTLFYLQNALKKNNSAHAFIALTQTYENENLFFDALFNLQNGIVKNPNSHQISTYLANLYQKSNNRDSSFLYRTKALESCKTCAVEQMNELAFWIENGKKEKINSLAKQLEKEVKEMNHPNLSAIHVLSDAKMATERATNKPKEVMNVLDFAVVFNRIANRKDTYKIETALMKKMLENQLNEQFSAELLFLEAMNTYKNGKKTEGIAQLLQLNSVAEDEKNLFGPVALGLLLEEAAFENYKVNSGEIKAIGGAKWQNSPEMLRAFREKQKKRAENLIKTTSINENQLDSLYQLAPYNPTWIIHLIDKTKAKFGQDTAYRLLVAALEDNPYESDLWKKYVEKSIEMNLLAYAEDGIQALQKLGKEEVFQKESGQKIKKKKENFGSY